MENQCRKNINVNVALAKKERDYFPVRERHLLETQAYKQAAQSLHIWRYPQEALFNFTLGLKILGLTDIVAWDALNKANEVRPAVLKIFEDCYFIDAYIRCLKRLNFKDFDPHNSNDDMQAWDEHWERAISANVLSVYFLKHAIEYAISGSKNSLNELMYDEMPRFFKR